MAALPYTISSSSSLSDDFILTSDVLVNLESISPLGVYQAGSPQALFARADGVLCQLTPTSGTSAAGWAMDPVGETTGVVLVVAGVQNDGTAHGFYTDAANLYHIAQQSDGTWSSADTLPLLTGLNVATNGANGELIAYGVNATGDLALVLQDQQGQWAVTSLPTSASNPISFAGTKPCLVFTDASNDWVMAVPGSAASGGYLDLYQGSTSAVLSGPEHVTVPKPVNAAVLGYYNGSSALFLFTDTSNNLYTSVGSVAVVEAVPNVLVAQAAAVLDYDSLLHVYAVDPSGQLSVLHQTGQDSSGAPVWAPIIPLDSGVQAVFTDSNPLDATAFFAVDDEAVLWSYVQDPTTNLWASNKAQTPGEQSYRVAQYRTEITVTDANGNPVANEPLTVTASSGSGLSQGGLLYPVGPATPVTVTTNPLGKVTLSTIASDLTTPALTIASGTTLLASGINPAQNVHAYLSGASATLNEGTSSSQQQAFSADVIQGATVDGGALAPATQGSGGTQLAEAACSGVQKLFQMNVPGNTVASSTTSGPVAFALDLNGPSGPRFLALHTEEEYRAFRQEGFFAAEAEGLGSWWSDVESFASDVWNGIKNAAISVTKFIVHVASATVDLVVQVAGEIRNIVGAAVTGVEDLVSAVQGIFAWIGAETNTLIDWLKMLFDWGAILDTSTALQSALSGAFSYMQDQITYWEGTVVKGFFAGLKSTVSTSFDTVIAQYAKGQQSMSSLVPASGGGPAVTARARLGATGSGMSASAFQGWQGSGQNNWLIDKIETFLGLQPTLAVVDGLADKFSNLVNDFDAVKDDFTNTCNNFANYFQANLQDPSQLGTLDVSDLLSAAKNVALAVLDFLDGIIDALLDVLSAALAAVEEIIDAQLDIPFFTSMFNSIASLYNVTVPNISVSGVFCTAIAIPVTVLYKIANGIDTEPFPGGTLPTGDLLTALRSDLAGFVKLADEDGAELAIQYTAAGIAGLWALMDTGLDCVPSVDLMVFKLLDLIAPTLLGVFTWPGGIPFTTIPLDNSEDKAAFANWIIGWVPVGLGVATMVAGEISWTSGSNVPRYIDPAGKILLSAAGAIGLVAGIVASSLGASGGAIASNIVGPLPTLTQFLRLESLMDSSDDLTGAIKMVIDFFAGEGLAVAIATS